MHPHATAIVQGIPAAAEFTDADRRNAERLLDACCTVIGDDFQPAELFATIARLGSYGSWLDSVRRAIDAADIDPVDRAAILGAFQMATLILFDAFERQRLKLHTIGRGH